MAEMSTNIDKSSTIVIKDNPQFQLEQGFTVFLAGLNGLFRARNIGARVNMYSSVKIDNSLVVTGAFAQGHSLHHAPTITTDNLTRFSTSLAGALTTFLLFGINDPDLTFLRVKPSGDVYISSLPDVMFRVSSPFRIKLLDSLVGAAMARQGLFPTVREAFVCMCSNQTLVEKLAQVAFVDDTATYSNVMQSLAHVQSDKEWLDKYVGKVKK
eukprot:c11062_g1_i2.p1 GENE.c11062_g1_i2~~c11062_g1_i2.p1  ORF type:complete len:212 (-),score=74.96 c11062_g1_i2:108-743(-)